jgi:hypothetical protein
MYRKLIPLVSFFIGMLLFMGQILSDDNTKKSNISDGNILTNGTSATIFPNVRMLPSSNTQQTGVDITRDPNNPGVLFSTALSTIGGGATFINSGVYVSTNGGFSWRGSDTLNSPKQNDQRGYPSPVIDRNGRFYVTHLTSVTGFGSVTGVGVNYSTDRGITWSSTVQIVNDVNADRSVAGTDDSPVSPYYGNVYSAWTTSATTPSTGRASRTTDGGATWSTPFTLNAAATGRNTQAHDIACGPNGEVYVVWTMALQAPPNTEDYIGFAKSTNGGITYTTTNNAFDVNGIKTSSFNGWGISANGFARIAVDKSNGPRRGWMYVVTAQQNLPPAGSDADIVLNRSTDNGNTWSPGIRVNQDGLSNGKVQFMPSICVDDGGIVHVVYYDNRGFASIGDSCSVYISSSFDGAQSWSDVEIADHHYKPKQATGFTGGYFGEYTGVASSQGKIVATWMDDKGGAPGNYNAWSGALQSVTYPLNSFNLQTPAPGVTITSLSNSNTPITISWDTSSATASYKWIFGSPTTTPRIFTLPTVSNVLTITRGQLDVLLANAGVVQGGQITGQWDVWAFRNNQQNDSLKASNGPRSVTLRRELPPLTAFSLSSPASGTTVTTSQFSFATVGINWTRSGSGTVYKWKFGSPAIGNVILSLPSNNGGSDSVLTIANRSLDASLKSLGLNPGDSIRGQWAVWAYSGSDSLRSSNVFDITFKRKTRAEVIIVYDSTTVACRNSRDSVIANLNAMGMSYDVFNRGVNVNSVAMSFREFKRILVLGEAGSVMSNAIKDSLKSYFAWGTAGQKAKVMIMAEDVGYHFDRPASVFYDPVFAREYLGFEYASDFPGSSGGKGLVGALANPNIADSTTGPRPDVLRKSAIIPAYELHELYKFRETSLLNGVGRIGVTYNVSVMAIDVESLRRANDSPPGSPVRRFLQSALDFVDGILTVSVNNISTEIPDVFSISQNYPNPFNPNTKIDFSLPAKSTVTLRVYDLLGKEVMTLLDDVKEPGIYQANFNAANIASGTYFYRIDVKESNGGRAFSETKRMILLK